MLMLLISLVVSAAAKTDACSISQILNAAKPDKKCIEAYLAKIPNEEDRLEAKFRLAQWKPIKDLHVRSGEGMIEAVVGEKLLMRTILLQQQKPMLIYMDGKILVDASDNPSFARRLDNAMKKGTSAAADFILPRAHAASPPLATTQQTLTLLYALDEPGSWGDATRVVGNSRQIENFIPARSWLLNRLAGAQQIRCATNEVVEPTTFRPRESTSDADTILNITPKSATEFIVTGLKRRKTHLIKLSTWEAHGQNGRKHPTLALRSASVNATLSVCADADCKEIEKTDALEKWNFPLRRGPDDPAPSLSVNRGIMEQVNTAYREELIGRLFGLSVMGTCCKTTQCRNLMLERFNVRLSPNVSAESQTDR